MSHKITITLETGNSAFEEVGDGVEVRRILEALAVRFERYGVEEMDQAVMADFNGNPVGVVKVQPC
jgi:hypothetical protein